MRSLAINPGERPHAGFGVTLQNRTSDDLNTALIRLYESGNDVIRCAAVSALSSQTGSEASADIRSCLLAGIRDEDPDVRVDAMAALKGFAEPQDAELIRESLIEDPVRDVKISAIEILAQLADTASTPLLLKLAQSKLADNVAWEDETDVWEDWLDVQIAAISALANLHVDEAIPVFLKLRDDEYGQELDPYIFPALARISPNGLDVLLDIARQSDLKSRSAALLALSRCDPALFQSLAETLAEDEIAEFRLLAIPHIDPTSSLVEQLALQDADPKVREAAVKQFGTQNQQLVWSALGDQSEAVNAVAADLLTFPLDERLIDAVLTNSLVWIKQASTPLAVAAAKLLPKLTGENAVQPLAEAVEDASLALEIRIGAARALADTNCEAALEVLQDQLANPSQQVRTAALSALAYRARQETTQAEQAVEILAAVISAEPQAEPIDASNPQLDDEDHHLEAPKTEDIGRPTVRISEDGEIIEDLRANQTSTSSTLANMEFSLQGQDTNTEAETKETAGSDEGDGVRGHQKKRRRVSVEGPDEFSEDLCARAIGIVAGITAPALCDAVEAAAASKSEIIRHAAILNLSRYSDENGVSASVEAIMIEALEEENPAIRALAAQALRSNGQVPSAVLQSCLSDPDPVVRAFGVETSVRDDASSFPDYILDPSRVVRTAALNGISSTASVEGTSILQRGLRRCLEAGYGDTLVDACLETSQAYGVVIALLNENLEQPDKCLALINALARVGNRPPHAHAFI